jgi:hypothetical protein
MKAKIIPVHFPFSDLFGTKLRPETADKDDEYEEPEGG